MYNTLTLSNILEILKKRLLYRASYRGTKEMDILLSSFVNKYIHLLDRSNLEELEKFLNFDDETILNFYNYNLIAKKIDENKISKLFKSHKI
jgi:antitoxin CptB